MSRRKKNFAFFLWHRRIGLAALVLVCILSITGILLNHTEDLKLDETAIDSDFILDWYNINPTGKPVSFSNKNIWVAQWGEQIFLNEKSLFVHKDKLQGMTQINDIIAIALKNNVLLVDNTGEIIELMHIDTRTPINKIGKANNRIALLDDKNNYYLSDKDLASWQAHEKLDTHWSKQKDITKKQRKQLKTAFRGDGLTLERVILDLHSGRLFNAKWGIYIMDASAILMILLGLSGLWIWWSRQLKMRHKKHYQKHH